MHRVGRWLNRGASASTQSLDSLSESHAMDTALHAVELIMDDDIAGAEAGVANGTSAFHKLARGTLAFMRAALGFEQDIMKQAADELYEAESAASANYYKAQHDAKAFQSGIYEKGSEFSLCQAEAQIMSAIVSVLNENLTESLKGFYKLRKAYMTLEGLTAMEREFMKVQGVRSLAASRQTSRQGSRESLNSQGGATGTGALQEKGTPLTAAVRPKNVVSPFREDEDDDGDEFFDAEDANDAERERKVLESYTGKLAPSDPNAPIHPPSRRDSHLEQDLEGLSVNDSKSSNTTSTQPTLVANASTAAIPGMITLDPGSEVFSNSLDIFIHSGTNLMFGILNLMISAVPPAFSRVLSIIGFRGDRERGLRMLWQASKFANVNGGMAGFVLFGFYNGLVGFCDIIPDGDPSDPDDMLGYPAARLKTLLAEMRSRYTKSYLWLIEEARMAAAEKDLDRGLELLDAKGGKSKLKQLEALHVFERSLEAMYAHRYELCATSFIECADLNKWSQALYYFIAGAAHVSLYRQALRAGDKEAAKKHKGLAAEYFETAPTKVGKKKMLGRQLPFEVFVIRKLAKWEERAKHLNIDYVDAVGVSPLEEMIYLWGGYKKMPRRELEASLLNLGWSEEQPGWKQEENDEKGILHLLRAVILRNLRRHDESMALLKRELIDRPDGFLKGHNKDDWPQPAAYYEMGVNCWTMRSGFQRLNGRTVDGPDEKEVEVNLDHDIPLVEEAKKFVERARTWEKYELDARMGMKVTAAVGAIKWWEQKYLTAR
ncbi:Mitochondrial outer membrane protein iml2 [Cyphellophora attinorum]|uniref:Inclusion body clearance protein IML2 n=1 Tax=Cyphellophora attinorum TaxID=1664694 RepID=A0A0N1GX45_9EURO|nr:Mitochondrial outer membrane protein iml2 [Phialophora attinorum]KPI34597.1 Mitochondrial outer membrane protein iml2 [Phialophora attinorum]